MSCDSPSRSRTCSSRVPGFYKLPITARRQLLAEQAGLDPEVLSSPLLDENMADHLVENVIGVYGLPLGVGLNFQVNGRDYLVPMCVEEPSVIAAASNAARMIREGGGFQAESDEPIMIAQVQLCEVPDTARAEVMIREHQREILARCAESSPSLIGHGGGPRGLEVRTLEASQPGRPGMMAVHLLVDVRDAMGANLVNTMAEAVGARLAELSGGTVGLRILSNLADRRCVRIRARVPLSQLGSEGHEPARVRDGIVAASRFAELDPYRAATHNKGIMNGIDAVVIATGNDWRGVESGAHAFAATRGQNGGYGPLAIWRSDENGDLIGTLEVPMAIGCVGGTLRVHPGARLGLQLLGTTSAGELGMVIACVGLASNLAALRAMASEGIQRGHMSLHARSVAVSAGATGELVDRVAEELSRLKDYRPERAAAVLAAMAANGAPKNDHANGHHTNGHRTNGHAV
jgi:hydroxymethylglutaryl-CoA reductase